MSYTITVSKVMSGRVKLGDKIEDFERPRYGFYWWFWVPKYSSNNGKFKRNECVDISLIWLCFSVGLIFWPKKDRYKKPARHC